MDSSQSNLTLYGTPLSQPVRAVIWLLLMKNKPFQLKLMNPGSKGEIGTRNPDFLKKNPNGTIPFLEDNEAGVAIAESHAILIYLCRKYNWLDLYPLEPTRSARIDWYLHSHHRGIRDASLAFFAPNVRKDLDFPESFIDTAKKMFSRSLLSLETFWLEKSRFIAGDDISIADLAAYVEVGQLKPEFTNLFDFNPFPKVSRWLTDMTKINSHDLSHTSLTILGDISKESPAVQKIVDANKLGYKSIMSSQFDTDQE